MKTNNNNNYYYFYHVIKIFKKSENKRKYIIYCHITSSICFCRMLHASIGEKKVNEKLFLSPGIVTWTIAIKTD